MHLDALVDVLTGKNRDGLSDTIIINGKPVKFVRGLVYQREVPSNGSTRRITEIELVYERPNSVLCIFSPTSLDEVKTNSEISPVEDLRHLIFGSRKLYKAFFDLLNNDKLRNKISDEKYLYIVNKVESLFLEMYNILGSACIFLKRRVIKDFRQELEQDPLVGHYIEQARIYINKI